MKFRAFIAFIALWSMMVYSPLAHMLWGEGGYLFKLGALDCAGGTVVHLSSGVSALVLTILLGKRTMKRQEAITPHNLPMTLSHRGSCLFRRNRRSPNHATCRCQHAGSHVRSVNHAKENNIIVKIKPGGLLLVLGAAAVLFLPQLNRTEQPAPAAPHLGNARATYHPLPPTPAPGNTAPVREEKHGVSRPSNPFNRPAKAVAALKQPE